MLGYFAVFRRWISSVVSRLCATATPAVFLAAIAILQQPVRSFASPNTGFQNRVLDFSLAYLIVDRDRLHCLILIPGEYLFIAHYPAGASLARVHSRY